MQVWISVTIFLCVFGFLKELRPIEPFIFEYLTGPQWWNLTAEQVQQDVFPISTYSYLGMLIIVFLFTDLCRYKPFMVLLSAAGASTFSLLVWSDTFTHLIILEVCYGTMLATEVAYFTYIYAKVSKELYTKVTSYARAAVLAGRCMSGVLAQGLTQLKYLNYKELNYITVATLSTATIWCFFLPSIKTTVYFHREDKSTQKNKYKEAFRLMKIHFIKSFSILYVIKWSIWWSLATCGYMLLYAYSQPLWSEIHIATGAQLYNGTIEAVSTLVGCFGAILVGHLNVNWKKWGEFTILTSSVLCGALLIICSQTYNIMVCYVCFVVYCGIYQSVITIATAEVSKHILEDSYGLVFGLNTFIALGLQTIIVLVFITGDLGWSLDPRWQHLAYGLYHIGIGLIFAVLFIYKCIFRRKNLVVDVIALPEKGLHKGR